MRTPDRLIYRHLTDDGLATGSSAMAVDGTTPVPFWIAPPATEKWVINRIIIGYEDAGTWTEAKFGILTALTNGLSLKIMGGATDVLLDLNDGDPIKNNAHWSHHCYDADIRSIGSGNTFFAARWTFTKDNTQGLFLSGHRKERLQMVVEDDLSDLVAFDIKCLGYKV